jgi:hypothetical protein
MRNVDLGNDRSGHLLHPAQLAQMRTTPHPDIGHGRRVTEHAPAAPDGPVLRPRRCASSGNAPCLVLAVSGAGVPTDTGCTEAQDDLKSLDDMDLAVLREFVGRSVRVRKGIERAGS